MSDYVELTDGDLVALLQEDAPRATCQRCHRKTWDTWWYDEQQVVEAGRT